ncbi:MAG: Ribonuclease J 1 (RNase J1) [Candidatus Roizmanbacteria bacterium GW2011_GWA2_32_13]|uniref:Ribonuclease J 1 (RNase J1) n=1 Tax=Candidatus Roizmanbacteria bacterium GW2011_GWA2_32_13 TaxID=1618475 RepID=A0A0G0BQN0_9BACT|nr:MAG: Ribonuclease J 1 (RNase J1) [Candidatus Roizmanbacteria bacterium GW2011_GWA2_32_13]
MKNNDNYNTANINKVKEVKLINPEPRVRIIPLGGLEEVGRNCTIIEYYEPETKKRDIIIIDLGLQFPEEAMMGIDFVIPNTYYLQNKIKDIKGIIITHGHYDHIGAIPYLMDKLGNPPIFAGALARSIILKRQDDFPNAQKPKIKIMNSGEKIDLGVFNILILAE